MGAQDPEAAERIQSREPVAGGGRLELPRGRRTPLRP